MLSLSSQLEQSLGHAGFLGAYRRYWTQGDVVQREAARAKAAEAIKALNALSALPAGRDLPPTSLREIGALTERFKTAAETADIALRDAPGAGAVPPAELDLIYATLKVEVARLRQLASQARIDQVAQIFDFGQIIVAAALIVLVFGLLAVASLIRTGISIPLNALHRSLSLAVHGNVRHKLWGIERSDEVGAIARAADQLRTRLAQTPDMSAAVQSGEVRIALDGPAAALFEKVVSEVEAASGVLRTAANDAMKAGGEGRTQLFAAAQKISTAAGDLSGLAASARSEVRSAAGVLEEAGRDVQARGLEAAEDLSALTQRLAGVGEALRAEAGQLGERALLSLSDLAETTNGLKQLSQSAHIERLDVAHLTEELKTRLALSLAEFRAALPVPVPATDTPQAPSTERAQLDAMLGRVEAMLTQAMSAFVAEARASAAAVTDAAKAGEVRAEASERRLGMALDAVARAGRMLAEDSATLKDAAQKLQTGSAVVPGAATAVAIPGAEALPALLERLTAATATLESMSLAIAGPLGLFEDIQAQAALGGPAQAETTAMALSNKPFAPRGTGGKLPIAPADMLARLGSIAEEVRAAAVVRAGQDAADGDTPCADDLRTAPAALEPAPVETLEGAAKDILRLADVIAELESRIEVIAQRASDALALSADGPGAPTELSVGQAAQLDAQTDEAIQTLFQSIERLNNIASALARAGDAERDRRYGD